MDRQKLARELADLPTSRLEQMYYPDVADWTEEARAIIRDALQHRQDLGTDRGPIIVVDSRLRAELLSKDGRGFPGGRRGTANEEATMLQLRVPRDLKQLCASALLVGLVASPAVAQPPPAAADSATQRETNFKAGFLNGCIKTKQQRGVDERYVRAYCLCAMLEFRAAMSDVACKHHANGALNPRAQFRREVSKESIERSPAVAGQLGVMDCSGVADGAAAAIVTRAEDAHKYTATPLYIKALSLVTGDGSGAADPSYDYTSFPEVVECARRAYEQAGITDPRKQLALAEVHDCFTPTEIILMEELGFAERGTAWKEVLAGTYDLDGELPVNPDGGLKAFGHPVGASGLPMMFEAWLQLRGEAPQNRRISTLGSRSLALTHNLGGYPGEMVSFVSILGTDR